MDSSAWIIAKKSGAGNGEGQDERSWIVRSLRRYERRTFLRV